MKQFPIGVDNFEEIIQRNLYYVDKTGLISDLMYNWGKVNLFTRPRRFGKSLNMSMLKSFFEIGTDKSLFDGLAISNEKEICEQYMGKYPVVFISLKEVDGATFESAYNQLRTVICDEALRLDVLANSNKLNEDDLLPYRKIRKMQGEVADIKNSLKMFCRLLEKHYGQKVILLIDEYDVPLDKAYTNGYYSQMIEVIRSMFSASLKSNDSLFFAVLTGCLRVSKESIFTGLNNLVVHSISDERFDEYFGFTDEEIKKILKDYNIENYYDEVKQWYDGYLFGEQEIYCPWDVINYCDELTSKKHFEPQAYWLHSSGNDIVRMMIKQADEASKMELESLIDGQTVTKKINEQLTHNEINDSIENIWSLLYMSGYLTITERVKQGRYVLKIPNKEVTEIFKSEVINWFKETTSLETDKLTSLYAAFKNGDVDTITNILNDKLLDAISFYDANAAFYHGFLLALLSTCSTWIVKSNIETGKGRSDIVVMSKDRKYGFVVEVKNVKDYDKLEPVALSALKQIDEKDYATLLRRFRINDVIKYGIAFCEKECKVVSNR